MREWGWEAGSDVGATKRRGGGRGFGNLLKLMGCRTHSILHKRAWVEGTKV